MTTEFKMRVRLKKNGHEKLRGVRYWVVIETVRGEIIVSGSVDWMFHSDITARIHAANTARILDCEFIDESVL